MNKEIKTIIEATSMGKLEKEAVIKSLLDLHNVSKCPSCGVKTLPTYCEVCECRGVESYSQ